MRRIAVTGANGFVGRATLEQLLAEGRDGVGIVRAGRDSTIPRLATRSISEWSESALATALAGMDAVIHSAAVVHRPGASRHEYERFNREGTEALVRAAAQAGVERIVMLGTIKVYGEDPPGIIDEATPLAPEGAYAETKLDAENVVLRAADEGGPSAAVLRLCPVYGRGDKGNVRTMIRAIAGRRFVIPGSGLGRKSIVHVTTVAQAAIAAADADVRGVFVVADREAPTIRALANAIARCLGRCSPLALPIAPVLAAATAIEIASGLMGRAPRVSRALIRKSLAPTVCSPARVEAALGIDCHVDLDWALRDEIAWLREQGLLR